MLGPRPQVDVGARELHPPHGGHRVRPPPFRRGLLCRASIACLRLSDSVDLVLTPAGVRARITSASTDRKLRVYLLCCPRCGLEGRLPVASAGFQRRSSMEFASSHH